MKTQEIRTKFIRYFESKGHKKLPSSSLVPSNDPTLLFTNAGMVQFKDEFTGKANPADKRAVTSQKCVRAGGKHNDLENVGFTARHHTFFEMLGNFSFGDYFKKEAISFAWEFLTKQLQIPKDKLYVTTHHTDKEAAEIWHEQEGIPKDRIFFRSDKDNFWEMGEIGPCGPSSEIFFDHGPAYSDPNADISECILDDEDRYVEVWNLVFMQFEKYKDGNKIKKRNLPKPSVDTGAGLERIAAVMQSIYNNFDGDAFTPIIKKIEDISGKKYTDHPHWMRVIADHARSASMLLADGVIPANEGRGYVLRRIIRRAVRHLDLLDVSKTTFFELVAPVFSSFGSEYEENKKNQDFVIKYLRLEEDGFRKSLASGLKLLNKKVDELKKNKNDTLSGKDAFTLYDTNGFPLDLTEMILKENGLKVDNKEFETEMAAQRLRSKKSGDFSVQADNSKEFYGIKEANGETQFVGLDQFQTLSTLVGKVQQGERTALIFDSTPFYAEGGGQQGDSGEIFDADQIVGIVEDTNKPVDGLFSHITTVNTDLEIGNKYTLKVDMVSRGYTMCNHTATHLLQAALISVLGNHVKQAGSNVGPKRLRFDFTHPESLSREELKQVEKVVNDQIKKQVLVNHQVMTKDEAMKLGAMALFGEKYGDKVRVINIQEFSIELCGGTHVKNTSEIGYFKILSESSLASGVRRIEAVSNLGAYEYVDSKLEVLDQMELSFSSKGHVLLEKLNQLQENLLQANKVIKSLKEKIQITNAHSMFEDVSKIRNNLDFKHIEANEDDDIKKIGDLFIDKFPKGVVLVTALKGPKAAILLKTFKGNKDLKCSDLLREAISTFGGKGGGKPDMAQGSVDADKYKEFVSDLTTRLNA
ncbi:MAG: alanine--tRNA ligase [Bacteriovoracaceae bacterium]|jgi:alanyl-tRNA synthetase|nr:alanine--tRNA ligase [Bacteriovoracaceae bacterium]